MEEWLEVFIDQTTEQLEKNQAKWGGQGAERLVVVLTEEIGEVARAVLEMVTATTPAAALKWRKRAQAEAVDVAAVCAELSRTVEIVTPERS